MKAAQVVVLAIIAEALWETLKMTWQDGKVSIDRIGSIIISLILAFKTELDLLLMVELADELSLVGVAVTGILISRGSNFIHDIFKRINKKEW